MLILCIVITINLFYVGITASNHTHPSSHHITDTESLSTVSSLKIQKKKSKASLIPLKLNDLVQIISTDLIGHIIKLNIKRREYQIQIIYQNKNNGSKIPRDRWIKHDKLKKLPIAYFHEIGELDDEMTDTIIDRYMIRSKTTNAMLVIPGCKTTDDVTLGLTYYYQNPEAYYLKLMSDFLILLSIIKNEINKRIYRFRNGLTNPYNLSQLSQNIQYNTFVNIKRLIAFIDCDGLNVLINKIKLNKYHPVLMTQISQLFIFCEEYKHIQTSSKENAKPEWETRLCDHLEQSIFIVHFDIDGWIYFVKHLMEFHNLLSERKFYNLVVYFRHLYKKQSVVYIITNEMNKDMLKISHSIDMRLQELNVTSGFAESSQLIQTLSLDKLSIFDSAHLVTYLYHWMINKRIGKDIHILMRKEIIENKYFMKHVMDRIPQFGVLLEEHQLMYF